MIDKKELTDGIHRGIHRFGQLFVFLVEEVGERRQQVVLGVEIVVERALGGLGHFRNVVDRGVFVAVLVEKLPRGGYDAALGLVSGGLFHRFSFRTKSILNFSLI